MNAHPPRAWALPTLGGVILASKPSLPSNGFPSILWEPLYDNAAIHSAVTAAVEQANAKQNAAWRLACEMAVAAERERCALLCESKYPEMRDGEIVQLPQFDAGGECAAAIRATP